MKLDFLPLYLKKREQQRLLQGHVWIYSNEIDTVKSPLKAFQAGQQATLLDSQGKALGTAYVNPHSLIAARVISRNPEEFLNEAFLRQKLLQAKALREQWYDKAYYRWVYGESDGLPGLVIDRYGSVLVVQLNTAGMEVHKNLIGQVLQTLCPEAVIVVRADSSMRALENLPSYSEVWAGEVPERVVLEENGVLFEIPALIGQKTGWFYDQRDNRAMLRRFVAGKSVLDVCCYLGSFGIQAACFGAKRVHCIDASATAIDYVKRNAALNHVADKVSTQVADAFDALKHAKEQGQSFEVVIIDPPAFIKKRKDFEAGLNAYRRLNELAVSVLAPGGLLVSASCSLHMPQENLIHCAQLAFAKHQRQARLIYRGQQGFDHPVHGAIPETAYLKCLFFQGVSRGFETHGVSPANA